MRNGKTVAERCAAMGFENRDPDELFHDVLDMLAVRTELIIKVSRSEDEMLMTMQGMERMRDKATAKNAELRTVLQDWVTFFDKMEEGADPNDPMIVVRQQVHGARIAATRAALNGP